MFLFDKFQTYYCMQNAALQRIRYDLLNYFQDIHVKVSIFLRLGQQNNDGTFIRPNIEDVPSGNLIISYTFFILLYFLLI